MKSGQGRSRLAGALVGVAGVAGLLAGCATPPAGTPAAAPAPKAGTAAPATPVAPSAAAAAAPAPRAAPVPEMSPAQAKAQAQKHVLEAVDQLQNGDEAAGRQSLERALALDPGSDLARNLRDQIDADAQKELGGVFFRYTVQRDDSLSKLAQQYLGDRFKFYILAKYNDIANPGRLAAGQVIKIPGKAPVAATPAPSPAVARPRTEPPAEPAPAPAPGTAPAAATAPAARPAEPETGVHADAKALVQRSAQLQKSGDLEGAYAAVNDALRRDGSSREAIIQRDVVRKALINRYEREAVAAFQRQNLDLAIARWTSVLELDPGNQKARLERERANDLKKRIAEKFGG